MPEFNRWGYGDGLLAGAQSPHHLTTDDTQNPRNTTFELPGVALGIGVLLGIVIGSKMTFHSPVRRRQYP